MRKQHFSAFACVLAIGCGTTAAPVDGGPLPPMCRESPDVMIGDAGTPPAFTCTAPDGGIPGTGACCYRQSQMGVADPELRLRWLNVDAPVGSPLMTPLINGVLNSALGAETFNWLFRVEGADTPGPVTIVTGFGIRNMDGTFSFPLGDGVGMFGDPRFLPAMIPGNITGEVVTSERYDGSIVVPVLNTEGTAIQLALELRGVRVIGGEFGSDRSCVGYGGGRGASLFTTPGILEAFIEVEPSRTAMVVNGPVMTTVCAAIATPATAALGTTYCDMPQADWANQPDSLCGAAGCEQNAGGGCDETVCDRGGDSTTGLPACNAWLLVSHFAAQGISITN
jgi:hypothetical protein